MLDLVLRGAFGDVQGRSDLPVGQSLLDQPGDFSLARAKWRRPGRQAGAQVLDSLGKRRHAEVLRVRRRRGQQGAGPVRVGPGAVPGQRRGQLHRRLQRETGRADLVTDLGGRLQAPSSAMPEASKPECIAIGHMTAA